jgi:hypothetical protein
LVSSCCLDTGHPKAIWPLWLRCWFLAIFSGGGNPPHSSPGTYLSWQIQQRGLRMEEEPYLYGLICSSAPCTFIRRAADVFRIVSDTASFCSHYPGSVTALANYPGLCLGPKSSLVAIQANLAQCGLCNGHCPLGWVPGWCWPTVLGILLVLDALLGEPGPYLRTSSPKTGAIPALEMFSCRLCINDPAARCCFLFLTRQQQKQQGGWLEVTCGVLPVVLLQQRGTELGYLFLAQSNPQALWFPNL